MSFRFLWKYCLSDLSNEKEYLVLIISAGWLKYQICFYFSSFCLNLLILSSFKDALSCSESMTGFEDNQICSGIWLYYSNHWRRQRQPTPVHLPGKSHGWRSLVGCIPWGRWVGLNWAISLWTRLSDFTFTFHFHALEKESATHSSILAWRIQGWGSRVGCHLWGRTESDTTKSI